MHIKCKYRRAVCTHTWCFSCYLANITYLNVCVVSDGVIRVFTSQSSRMADEGCQTAFEEEVASSAIPTQIGDLKRDQIPGPEVLFNPGQMLNTAAMILLILISV